jgi:Xaa-Pro dipeptidase
LHSQILGTGLKKVFILCGKTIFLNQDLLTRSMKLTPLKKVLQERRIDIALFYNIDAEDYDRNLYYFSGYKGMGCLVVPRVKKPFLVVPLMEYERARKTGIRCYKWEKGKLLFERVNEILRKNKIKPKKVGFSYRDMSLDVYKSLRKYVKKIKVRDIGNDSLGIRRVKTPGEIAKLRKACKLTDKLMKKCVEGFGRFKTEKDVGRFLMLEAMKEGCEMSFPPVVASGRNASMPHYEPGGRLKKGFCIIDMGMKYEGQHADITRTIYIGNPSKKERAVYGMLLKVQKELIRRVKKGKKCSDLYEEAVELLGEYGERFTHGLGHGLGLQIHEFPNLKQESKEILDNGMVFTIEPGIYFEGKSGIRIEDDVLINNGRVEILTRFPKVLIVKKAR